MTRNAIDRMPNVASRFCASFWAPIGWAGGKRSGKETGDTTQTGCDFRFVSSP
jgi:hypothetical protein